MEGAEPHARTQASDGARLVTQLAGPPLAEATGIGALTLGGFLTEVVERFGPNEALVLDDPLTGTTVRWTYADLGREARRVARALLATDLGKGNRVGILMANRPEAVAAFFGAALTGAVVIPLSTFSTTPELAFLLGHADLSVLLTQTTMGKRRFADDVVELCPATAGRTVRDPTFPYLRHVAAVGPVDDAAGIEPWSAFLARGDGIDDALLDAAAAQVTPSDLGIVIYSSGTTDRPKGVLHHQQAPTLQFWLQSKLFARDESTRMWSALPMFWTAGMNTAMGATLAAGGCWVMQEGFDPGEALRLMARERVTEPYTLPHQAAALEEHPDWAATDLSSLTKVFGKSVFTRHPSVKGDTGWNMPTGYGLSETCAFFAAHASDAPREHLKSSIGRLLPGNELRIVDPDTGRLLGPDEDGEMAIRGPTLMEHYVKRSRAECLDDDGFFHTGDMGFYDNEGFVHFTGRRTEMIKTGGANVSPAELEVQLRACEPVKLARVVGVPDARLDQLVILCVVLKDGYEATGDEIRDFLRQRVAAYKVPKQVLFFADGEIPMTSSETKVRDEALLALVQARLTDQPRDRSRR
ncbi:MAG: AMP-dependent synthetase and ligase [Acidimicrobiales bacterium]|nr:AMP-dependent synthetase and ligase [Acidimicrobiales bacterium]